MATYPSTPPPPPLDLLEGARWLGQAAWLEERLFEVLGGWVASTPEPVAKLALGAHSRHAGWRAGQLRERLPELRELPADEQVAPAGPHVVEALDDAAALSGTAERLAVVHRLIVPRQLSVLRAHLDRASPVADGPTIRTLRMIVDDLGRDLGAGEVALETVLADADDPTEAVRVAAAAVAAVEAPLVVGGGLTPA